MKFRWDKKYLYWGITAFVVICASICFYYILFHRSNLWDGIHMLLNITMPVLDGFVLAYVLSPVLNHIEKKVLYPVYASVTRTEKENFSEKAKKNLRKIAILFTIMLVLFLILFLLHFNSTTC